MRTRIREFVVDLLHCLLDKLDPIVLEYDSPDTPEEARVLELVRQWKGVDASGEYKRHQVLARMKKEFPNAKYLGLLIEQAVIDADA